jgi:hypothetical protein
MGPVRSHQRLPEPNRGHDCPATTALLGALPRRPPPAQLTIRGVHADAHGMTRETGKEAPGAAPPV